MTRQDGLSEEGPAKTKTGWWPFTSKEQQHPEGVLLAQTSEDGVLKDIKHHTKELADITPKVTNIDQNLSNLKINDDLATKRLTKLEQQVEGEIRKMTG